jgi:hypothetical protein
MYYYYYLHRCLYTYITDFSTAIQQLVHYFTITIPLDKNCIYPLKMQRQAGVIVTIFLTATEYGKIYVDRTICI